MEGNITMDLKEWDGSAWTGLTWLKIGTSDGSCEHMNEYVLNC